MAVAGVVAGAAAKLAFVGQPVDCRLQLTRPALRTLQLQRGERAAKAPVGGQLDLVCGLLFLQFGELLTCALLPLHVPLTIFLQEMLTHKAKKWLANQRKLFLQSPDFPRGSPAEVTRQDFFHNFSKSEKFSY